MQKPKEFKIANHKPTKKTIILFTSLFSVIALIMIYSIVTTPRDLGPKLHYIGRATSGCLPPPLFACFSPIITSYYYGTDLSREELKDYLENAVLIRQDEDGFGSYPTTYYSMNFKSKTTNENFNLEYYVDTESIIKYAKLKNSKYRYIIDVTDYDYKIIQKSL